MKKKLLALLLIVVMGMSTLTGCAQVMYTLAQKEQTTETEEVIVDEDTEEVIEENTEEVEEEATEVAEEDSTEATATTGSGEVDFDVAEGTLENPAKIGEWVATKTYSSEDDQYHTIYYRITGVIRGDEAQKTVDDYNAGDNFVVFEELEYDELEYCVVTYETHYPSDFPEGEYGLYSADVDLGVCNLEDSGGIEGYIGLSSVWDISETPEEFHAGDTFTEGKAIFAMVKDFSDYLFYASYYDDDSNEFASYVKGE